MKGRSNQNDSGTPIGIIHHACEIAKEFDYDRQQVRRATDHFLEQMKLGLSNDSSGLAQIPSYVTSVPDGTEKGFYLVVDLGGTNLRVCSVQLNGDTSHTLTQQKVAIPTWLMVTKTYKTLFFFIARQIETFLRKYHGRHLERCMLHEQRNGTSQRFKKQYYHKLGFTFSFTVHQQAIDRGVLLYWDKGFNIRDAVGKDVCAMLQEQLDELKLPVLVTALVNDTVSTLMSRSYTSPGTTKTLLGAVFGTGTNGAYVERTTNIKKLHQGLGEHVKPTSSTMVVNTEWGAFDDELRVLPKTSYDLHVDQHSVNPGHNLFEKRVSGMYLGEILRRTIVALVQSGTQSALAEKIPSESPLYALWAIDSSFLSTVAADDSADLATSRLEIEKMLRARNISRDDAQAVKILGAAITKRAARLAGVAIAAICIHSNRLRKVTPGSVPSNGHPDYDIDIGVDGSLVEFYSGFITEIRGALQDVEAIGLEGEQRIRIGLAKDGSGVGAALIVRAALLQEEKSNLHVLSKL